MQREANGAHTLCWHSARRIGLLSMPCHASATPSELRRCEHAPEGGKEGGGSGWLATWPERWTACLAAAPGPGCWRAAAAGAARELVACALCTTHCSRPLLAVAVVPHTPTRRSRPSAACRGMRKTARLPAGAGKGDQRPSAVACLPNNAGGWEVCRRLHRSSAAPRARWL